jgi:hypothetical protein
VDAQEFAISIPDDQQMLECFLNFLDINHAHPFVLDFETIRNGQQQDPLLLASLQREPQKYANMLMANNVSLIVQFSSNMTKQDSSCTPLTLKSSKFSLLPRQHHKSLIETVLLDQFHYHDCQTVFLLLLLPRNIKSFLYHNNDVRLPKVLPH